MQGRYRSHDDDSARWDELTLRSDDIIVSTRSKHGTTWVQTILLHLIHGPRLAAPLPQLSPWVDHLVEDVADLASRLEAQSHRRVLKTHTPLDGVPLPPGVRAVVVARHPLDAAVSLYHQGANIDRERLAALSGRDPHGSVVAAGRPEVDIWLQRWVEQQSDPCSATDSLNGVAHHLGDAWRRRDDDTVTMVHFQDLMDDRGAQIARLCSRLKIDPAVQMDELVAMTGFDAMRTRSDVLVPDAHGVLADHQQFFRRGSSGAGREMLPPEVYRRYRERMAGLLPHALDEWLHREDD